MRFLLVTAAGGVVFGLLDSALRNNDGLRSVHPLILLGLLALVAFATGLAARPRGWLAALAAFVLGTALWVGIELRPSPPWMASDVWGWDQWGMFGLTMMPTTLGVAAFGAVGAWAAGVVGSRMRHAEFLSRSHLNRSPLDR